MNNDNFHKQTLMSTESSTISENEYFEKYKHLYGLDDALSDKLRKYNLVSAQKDIDSKHSPYVYFLANARKAFSQNVSVYKLDDDVLERIYDTSIDKMTDDIPSLYKNPFIIEPKNTNENLFGDIDCVIGFFSDFEGLPKGVLTEKKNFIVLFHTRPNNDKI